MDITLILLQKAINAILSALFGILFVPLSAVLFFPAFGLLVVAVLAAAIPLAKRRIGAENWRRPFGWSLLMPGVGLWLWRRLLREDPAAAATSLRLALIGGAAMLLLSVGVNTAGLTRVALALGRAMESDQAAVEYMRGAPGRASLEKLRAMPVYQKMSGEQRSRFERAWRTAQRERWRTQIQSRAQHLPLESTRALLKYDQLAPSQQAEFDAAWRSLGARPPGTDRPAEP